jgi:hypothetical protein
MGEISTIGLDLAKSVFVRPASRVSFCFTGGISPEETGCSISRSLPGHAEPVTARYEALGTK